MPRYKLDENSKVSLKTITGNPADEDRTVTRIRALQTFTGSNARGSWLVAKDTPGGYIEHEDNLSQSGGSWLFGGVYGAPETGPVVWGDACVNGSAYVKGKVRIYGASRVSGRSVIGTGAQSSPEWIPVQILENAVVTGDAEVACRSQITGYAQVYDHALVTGQSIIRDYAIVSGNARIINSLVGGHSRVYQNAVLYTELDAYYKVEVSGYTRIYGTAFLRSGAKVTGNARISGCVVLEKATLATENAVVYGSDVIGDEEKPVVITNAGYVTSCPEKQSKNDCFEEPAMDHCQ